MARNMTTEEARETGKKGGEATKKRAEVADPTFFQNIGKRGGLSKSQKSRARVKRTLPTKSPSKQRTNTLKQLTSSPENQDWG